MISERGPQERGIIQVELWGIPTGMKILIQMIKMIKMMAAIRIIVKTLIKVSYGFIGRPQFTKVTVYLGLLTAAAIVVAVAVICRQEDPGLMMYFICQQPDVGCPHLARFRSPLVGHGQQPLRAVRNVFRSIN
jgi:hypothetical protein